MARGYDGNNVFIGVGGTGARILEGIIYLSAIGFMGEKDKNNNTLKVLLIDQDANNGNVNRTLKLLETYKKLIDNIKNLNDRAGFSINLEPFAGINLLTVIDERGKVKLIDFIDDEKRGIYEVLFTNKELSMELNEGFRGLPTIGIVSFYQSFEKPFDVEDKDETDNNNYKKLFTELRGHRAVIGGSIFGGTGASGIPALGKRFRKVVETLGGIFLFPYFEFKSEPVEFSGETIKPVKSLFMLKALRAANYYLDSKDFDYYNTVYFLGLPEEEFIRVGIYSEGGRYQENNPTFIEVASAYALDNILLNKKQEGATFNLITDHRDEKYKAKLSKMQKEIYNQNTTLREALEKFAKASIIFIKLIHNPDYRTDYEKFEDLINKPETLEDTKNFAINYLNFYNYVDCSTRIENKDCTELETYPIEIDEVESKHILRKAYNQLRKIKENDLSWPVILSLIYDSTFEEKKKGWFPFK